jgi:hypothetical protein
MLTFDSKQDRAPGQYEMRELKFVRCGEYEILRENCRSVKQITAVFQCVSFSSLLLIFRFPSCFIH